MPRKPKIPATEKVELVEEIVFENKSLSEAAKISGIERRTLRDWVSRYHSEGRTAFLSQEKNRVYGPEEKAEAVKEYLRGEIGLRSILVIVFCISGFVLPCILNTNDFDTLLCLLGGVALSMLVINNT